MEVMSHLKNSDPTGGGTNETQNQSEFITTQPMSNGKLQQPGGETLPPHADRLEDGERGGDSVTDSAQASDEGGLPPERQTDLVSPTPLSVPLPTSPSSPLLPCPPSSSSLHHLPPPPTDGKRPSAKSPAPFRTDSAHLRAVAGDDCCAHCVLACLFCELLSMCSVLGECLACGGGVARCCDAIGSCCFCCCAEAGGAACMEEACQALLDCGIVEDCCGSTDCLEVCLECCAICFPA